MFFVILVVTADERYSTLSEAGIRTAGRKYVSKDVLACLDHCPSGYPKTHIILTVENPPVNGPELKD